jgi:hypothetical protein
MFTDAISHLRFQTHTHDVFFLFLFTAPYFTFSIFKLIFKQPNLTLDVIHVSFESKIDFEDLVKNILSKIYYLSLFHLVIPHDHDELHHKLFIIPFLFLSFLGCFI